MLLYFSKFQLTCSKYIWGLISWYIYNCLYQNSSNSLPIVPYRIFILSLISNGKEVGERLFWGCLSFLEVECMLTQMLHKKLQKAYKVTLCVLFCVYDFKLLEKIRKEELGDIMGFLPSKQDLIWWKPKKSVICCNEWAMDYCLMYNHRFLNILVRVPFTRKMKYVIIWTILSKRCTEGWLGSVQPFHNVFNEILLNLAKTSFYVLATQ